MMINKRSGSEKPEVNFHFNFIFLKKFIGCSCDQGYSCKLIAELLVVHLLLQRRTVFLIVNSF